MISVEMNAEDPFSECSMSEEVPGVHDLLILESLLSHWRLLENLYIHRRSQNQQVVVLIGP
jgi:hypothetical protein